MSTKSPSEAQEVSMERIGPLYRILLEVCQRLEQAVLGTEYRGMCI